MDKPFSLTNQQVDIVNMSLEKAMAISELLVDCGPMERTGGELPSRGSLTVVFQMVVDELGKITEVMQAVRE